MKELSDLIPEFVEESLEHLGNIDDDINIMQQGSLDNDLIDRVSRVVHSIKGGASFLGLRNMEQLSRKTENILNLVRNSDLEFSPQISTCIFKAVATLKEMLASTSAGTGEDLDISANLKELGACLHGKPISTTPRQVKLENEDGVIKLDEYIYEALKRQGKKLFHIQFELMEGQNQNYSSTLEFFREVEKTGEIIERKVDMELVLNNEGFSGAGIPLSLIYATTLDKDIVAYIFGIDENQVVELKDLTTFEDRLRDLEEIQTVERRQFDEEPGIEPWAGEEVGDIEVEEWKEKDYVTFLVGDEEYAVDITQVLEIIPLPEITRIPGAEKFTKGVIDYRGEIIPVYDFRLRLNLVEREYDPETVILILIIGRKKAGVIVDRASEVFHLTQEQITRTPHMLQIPSEYVMGIGQKDGRSVVLLKTLTIFNIEQKEERIS
ncbi:MAG: purine-binding chemotaxis protein CheW [Acidobacteriota bacterium]|nr:purine-binding chemotaxis protein CheW [Acidobacteriota bacterium]